LQSQIYLRWHERSIKDSWPKYLDENHLKYATIDNLSGIVSDIVINANTTAENKEGISW
jgi:hypothetical protein